MPNGIRSFVGLLIVLAVAGSVFLWTSRDDARVEPVVVRAGSSAEKELIEVPVLKDTQETLSDQSMKLTVDAHYPTVLLSQNANYAKEANAVIAGTIDGVISEFKNNVSEMGAQALSSDDLTSDLTMRFTPLLLSPTMISIRFDVSEYYAGAAHPNNYARVLNYHFEKHQVLSTPDLFASSTEALPFLSRYSRAELKKTFSDISEEEFALQVLPGTDMRMENWGAVGITKNGLTVIFNPYQVAPYARGTSDVKIPLNDLVGIIAVEVADAIRMASENILEATPI